MYRIFVGLVDSTGYNFGTAGPEAVAGTMLIPYQVRYAQGAEVGMPDRSTVDFTGGDIWTGSYVYGITSLGTFEITSSTVEADMIAFLSDSAVDQTTNSRQTIYSENIMLSTPPQAWLMTVFRLQSKETGSKGANKFITLILPRTWVTPKGISGAPAFQSAGTYGYTIIPTVGDRFPWGPPFACTTMGLANDEAPVVYIITDYPVHTVGYLSTNGNATESISLPYKPITFDYTTPDSSTDPVQVWVDGISTNADSITQSNGQVVVSPIAPAATFTDEQYIGIFYETEYESTTASALTC